MKVGLFLGAGASKPFDKPTTAELQSKLIGRSDDLNDEILQSFLLTYATKDIEYVLEALKDIRKFSESIGGKYFFEKGKNGMFSFNRGGVPFDSFVENVKIVEKKVEEAVYKNYRWNRHFNDALVKIYNDIFGYLRAFNEINVFTTNYDRAIETYCHLSEDNYRLFDGFWRKRPENEFSIWKDYFDDPIVSGDNRTSLRLYKLHGSLNWKQLSDGTIVKTIEESKPSDTNFSRNMVIMPTRSPKDEEEEEPFRTLKGRFRKFMASANACVVIGFSFRDNLNDIFKDYVNRGKTLIIISPTAIRDFMVNVIGEKEDGDHLPSIVNNDIQVLDVAGSDNPHIFLYRKELKADNSAQLVDTWKSVIANIQKDKKG
ncbi:SIR2 family protein [Nitrososphaera sp.]|uniref:SIR2 family protein n=1 Tax=Nitrososphaera sp. TaxID=1971748 RepID=UPI002ED8E06F